MGASLLRCRYAWLVFTALIIMKEVRALETKDWQQAWSEGQTGFHRDDVNPLLIDYWPSLTIRWRQVMTSLFWCHCPEKPWI